MARSNTVVLSQHISKESRENITEILLQCRKSFQRLFECAAIAASSGFKRGGIPVSSREATPQRYHQVDGDSDDDSTFENSDLQHLGRSEYESLAESYAVDGNISKKAAAFRNFMSRPNIHTALHYQDVITEYATPNNCATLSGEDKHRFFKKAVTHTNFRDVEKVLLNKESINQTLRFILAGSFSHTEPCLTEQITAIHAQCPTLLNDLLPYSEAAAEAGEDAGENGQQQSTMSADGDGLHKHPMAIGCLERSRVLTLGWPLWPGRLDASDPFYQQLQTAYDIDYQEANVVLPKKAGLQWCHKFSFTDRLSQHRVTFKTGEFIAVRGNAYFGRVDGAFLHQLSPGRIRLFVCITRVERFESEKQDPVLKAPLLKLGKATEIIGLPGIGGTKHFILQVMRQERENGSKRGLVRGGRGLLLYWNNDIQFM